jgi:molybdate transport system ATP-binding protein
MATLEADFTLPLRAFALELELELSGTVALVGPSGAGKTSVLHVIAGLRRPSRGGVSLDGASWDGLPPEERRVGLVFQDYALFPHLSVRANVAFGARGQDVEALLERFRIGHLAAERPHELSGGERQRVALARALARDPAVLLLDEPLAALDAHTKAEVRHELAELLRELALPTLLVTHDYEDAAALAAQVGVLVEGKLRQLGTPAELVARPRDAFVASFTGANLLHGRAHRGEGALTAIRLESGEDLYSVDEAEGEVGVVVYPWEVSVARTHAVDADSALNVVRGQVGSLVEAAGPRRSRTRRNRGPRRPGRAPTCARPPGALPRPSTTSDGRGAPRAAARAHARSAPARRRRRDRSR